METLTKHFAATLRKLDLPEAKLSREFTLTNLCELDDHVQAALDNGSSFSEIYFALAGARTLVRLEKRVETDAQPAECVGCGVFTTYRIGGVPACTFCGDYSDHEQGEA